VLQYRDQLRRDAEEGRRNYRVLPLQQQKLLQDIPTGFCHGRRGDAEPAQADLQQFGDDARRPQP